MRDETTSNRWIFWIIIFISIVTVMVMIGVSIGSQVQSRHSEATIIAGSTMTVEFIETHYQKGLGYINIGRWLEAKREFELVFEIDPDYKDVQAKLVEIYDEISELNPIFTPAPTLQLVENDQIDNGNDRNETAPSGMISQDGLVAYYPFDGNANDESGNRNNGKEYGGVKYVVGKIGQAASFDGIDDYIEIIPQRDVSSIGDFTISVWTYVNDWKIQTSTNRDRQYIFDGHTHSNLVNSDFYREGFALIYDGNSNTEEIHNFIYYDSKKFLEQNTRKNVTDEWHFLVFMRKGDDDFTYLDGQLITSTYDRNHKSNDILDMNHKWFIGTFSGNNPYYRNGVFNYSYFGLLDELRIHNRALSDAEIQELFNAGL